MKNRTSSDTVNKLYEHHNTLKLKVEWDIHCHGEHGEIVVKDRKTGHEFAKISGLIANYMPINNLLYIIIVMRNSFFSGVDIGEEQGQARVRNEFKKILGD